jgi:hypothetical protein
MNKSLKKDISLDIPPFLDFKKSQQRNVEHYLGFQEYIAEKYF